MTTRYSVWQHPRNGLWYVVSPVRGAGYSMPVTGGYTRRGEAVERIGRLIGAERAMRAEIEREFGETRRRSRRGRRV